MDISDAEIKVKKIVEKYGLAKVFDKALVGCILLLAAIVRFVGVFKPDLIFDEGYTALAVRGIIEKGLPILPSGILYPRGIVYSYLSALIDLFVRNEIVAIRIVSVIAGIATVYGIYLLAQRLLESRAGAIFVMIIAAFSLHLIEASRYGRFYSLMLCGFVFATYFALRVFDDSTKTDIKDVIAMLGFAVLTIFSDSLGVAVTIPIAVIILLGILKRGGNDFENLTLVRWIKKYWFVFISIIVVVGISGVLQFWLERYTFYSTYRKLIDEGSVRDNALNLPISFSPTKFGGFLVAINKILWLESIFVAIALLALKLKQVASHRVRPMVFLLLTSFGFFTFVVLVAPQFQIRFFYILYVLLIILMVQVLLMLEKKFKIHSLIKFLSVSVFTGFLLILPIIPIEKHPGSFPESSYLPSSSLDYFPDSWNAFNQVTANQTGPQDLLFSTYRKELAYYPRDFLGMKFVVVPYQLENSLKSMPLEIYREEIGEDVRNNLDDEVAWYKSIFGEDKEILVDPVTGEIIIRPEELILISNGLAGRKMFIVTSRFDYNRNYVSERYMKFLEGNQHRVVYLAEDEGYSSVYGF